MDRPGGVFPIQTKRGDEEFSRMFGSLKEQAGPLFRKDQRHGLAAFELGIFENSNVHEIAVVRGEKRVKDRMIGKYELKLFRRIFARGDYGLGLETQFAQATADSRGDAVDQQDHPASVGQVAPEQFAGISGLLSRQRTSQS